LFYFKIKTFLLKNIKYQ